MANRKKLLGGSTVKVQSMSGFDKSHFNALTAPLGAIVPLAKQLMIPGKFTLKVKLSAQLPPLASDAFLRTHLKVEAFLVPLRLCYGGFSSWFSGEQIAGQISISPNTTLTVAKLPRLVVNGSYDDSNNVHHPLSQTMLDEVFGPHTLMDYFGVKYPLSNGGVVGPVWTDPQITGYKNYSEFNIFPFLAYQLCYHHWYRNKLVERPLFAPRNFAMGGNPDIANFPWTASSNRSGVDVWLDVDSAATDNNTGLRKAYDKVRLLNGHLLELRQRNYGFDYFTTALPSAQDGSPISVDTSAGNFTISALRIGNRMQHFAEVNQLSGPDFVQTCRARYGKAPGSAVAQKPVLLGSADFPMYTSGVEQTAQDTPASPNGNPFAGIASRYGRAHAEGSDFVCECDVDEPSYLMVMVSLVPEANYAVGVAHDMRLFTQDGSIVDLPCAELEGMDLEPVYREELAYDDSGNPSGLPGRAIFGYQPRYMWHKAGAQNEVHGLFRAGASLEAFIPQRLGVNGGYLSQLNTAFLKVHPSDLDNVTAVAGAVSQYGVMIDSSIELYVSEPLGESVMPSLVDPAAEHGNSIYLSRGGISVND